jgi:Ser/Thr protein kinase RdoA (MazF antagonist)
VLLDVDRAIPYLIERRYLTSRDVVEVGVRVVSASRRNRNLRVERRDGSGWLVKQSEAAGSRASLSMEAAFYRMCQHDARAEAVRPVVPVLTGLDDAAGAIFIELIGNGVPLSELRHRFTEQRVLGALGAAIGQAIGTYHRAFRSLVGTPAPDCARLSPHPPWVLWVHRPGPEILGELSEANRTTLRILQDSGALAHQLDRLRRGWRVETLIHGDLKADNLLVVGDLDAEPPGAPVIKVVDWELVQLGDPAWDVAAICKDFVLCWIASMPVARGVPAAELIAKATQPLAGFQHGLRAMWRSYTAAAELGAKDADAVLLRASAYAAAWLVQSAYEHAHSAAELGNHEVMMLQVAANVLADPADAALRLFGIPLRSVLR